MPKKTTALTARSGSLTLADAPGILDRIPDVGDDPTPRMAEAIMAAADPTDWAAIFEAKSLKKNVAQQVRITDLRKAPSSFEGGLPFYLVADVTYLETGEQSVMSISSQMAVLQLLVAHERGWLPIDVEIVQKDKPTKKGFFPIHLRALAPAKQVSAAG